MWQQNGTEHKIKEIWTAIHIFTVLMKMKMIYLQTEKKKTIHDWIKKLAVFFFSGLEPIKLGEINSNKWATNESYFIFFVAWQKWLILCQLVRSISASVGIDQCKMLFHKWPKSVFKLSIVYGFICTILYRVSSERGAIENSNTWHFECHIRVQRIQTRIQLIHENRIISTLADNIPENFINPPTFHRKLFDRRILLQSFQPIYKTQTGCECCSSKSICWCWYCCCC